MALCGTITVTTTGFEVAFSTDPNYHLGSVKAKLEVDASDVDAGVAKATSALNQFEGAATTAAEGMLSVGAPFTAAVALVVKRAARAAGLEASRLAGHSLRANLATSAAKAGRSERAIIRQTGHRSSALVRR